MSKDLINEAERISMEIFYSPATNGKAAQSIKIGKSKILSFAQRYSASDDFDLERLYEWLMDENREPAQTKFTAGILRNVAKEIESQIKNSSK